MPNVDPQGTTRFADEATLEYIAELEARLDAVNRAFIKAEGAYDVDLMRRSHLMDIKNALQPKDKDNG